MPGVIDALLHCPNLLKFCPKKLKHKDHKTSVLFQKCPKKKFVFIVANYVTLQSF